MGKYLDTIENYDYKMTKERFNQIIDTYIDYSKVYSTRLHNYDREKKLDSLIHNIGGDGGCSYIYDVLVNVDDKSNFCKLSEGENYVQKLHTDRMASLNQRKFIINDGYWIYADCRDNNSRRKVMNPDDVRHRFYISPRKEELYKFCIKLYDKFKDDEVNVIFKTINTYALKKYNMEYRRDAIVVYVDDENFDDVCNSLVEFSLQNEELIRRCNKPSLATLNIESKGNVWLGYAKESKQRDISYTTEFAMCLKRAIDDYCIDYIKKTKPVKFTNTKFVFGTTEFDYKTFSNHYMHDLRAYILSRDILMKEKNCRDELYMYFINELSMAGFNLNNFPVHRRENENEKVKVKKPNE